MICRYYGMFFVVLSAVGTIPLAGSDEVKHPPINYAAKKVTLDRCITMGALFTGVIFEFQNQSLKDYYLSGLPLITIGLGSLAKGLIKSGEDLRWVHQTSMSLYTLFTKRPEAVDVDSYDNLRALEASLEAGRVVRQAFSTLKSFLLESTKLDGAAAVGYGIVYMTKHSLG